MPNFHTPIIIDRATEIYRAITIELERERQRLGWAMWKVDDAAGLQDGHYAKLLHADRRSGRCVQWPTLQMVISALFPKGFDLVIKHKAADPLTAENHRLKVMFAAADNNRLSRRELMATLGREGGKARAEKYKTMTKEERQRIAKKARKTRRRNRLLRAQSGQIKPQSKARRGALDRRPDPKRIAVLDGRPSDLADRIALSTQG